MEKTVDTEVEDAVGVAVIDGAGEAVRDVVAEVVVVGSLQPNQPGVLHVEVEVDGAVVDELVVVVVVSSRQPHQPGVLHVDVRVRVVVFVEEEEDEEDVVESDPLLSKYFQLKQSTHSVSETHWGMVSYFERTLSITLWIL